MKTRTDLVNTDQRCLKASDDGGGVRAELRRWRHPKRNRPFGDAVRGKADLDDFKFMTFGRPREIDYLPAWWR